MKKWTEYEKNFLKENYPLRGAEHCKSVLNRSINGIYTQALKLNLKSIALNRVGEKFKTVQGYEGEITEYFGAFNSTVKFDDGTIIKNVHYSRIANQTLSNPNHKTIFGVGYLGQGKYNTGSKNGKTHYITWSGMIERCYDEKKHIKSPTYKDCSVHPEWHNFQNFAKWFEENYQESFQLDKDILVKGNKIYSPETCCFVPKEINLIFNKRGTLRGKYPIGVSLHRKSDKFKARMGRVYLGIFNTEIEAFQAYKTAKEAYIKEVADKWKGLISDRVYKALYNYEVEITD